MIGIAATLIGEIEGMRRTFDVFERAQNLRGDIAAAAHESFDGALTVKALGREEHETARFAGKSEALHDVLVRIGEIWGNVLAENDAMLKLARELGFKVAQLPDEPGVARITKRIT